MASTYAHFPTLRGMNGARRWTLADAPMGVPAGLLLDAGVLRRTDSTARKGGITMSGSPTFLHAAIVGLMACAKSKRIPVVLLILAGLILMPALTPPSARAIDIVIQLGDEGENPFFDPAGLGLRSMFYTAAAYWEDYLPEEGETGTYEVDIFWSSSEFDDDPTSLGVWYYQAGGDNNIYINPYPLDDSGSPIPWYIDQTPTDHSEFDFENPDRFWSSTNNRYVYQGGTWHYGEVDPNEQSAWFGGSPPDLMEIGYRGAAKIPALEDQYDLFSTAIHELGHELGVNSSGGPWEADPAWLAGGTATIYENADEGHLAARTSLMCEGCGLQGTRRMPSAIDIMAVADDEVMSTHRFASSRLHRRRHLAPSLPLVRRYAARFGR